MTSVPYFDESFQPISDNAAAYRDDYRVLSGYGGTDSPKTLPKARIDAWFSQGDDTGIAALFEATAGRALSAGKSGGAADARASRAYWRSVGMPDDCMITPAVDVDVSTSDLPALRLYFTGWKSADTCLPWAYIEPDIGVLLYAEGLIGGIFAPAATSWDPEGKASYLRPHVGWTQERNGVNAYGGNIDIGHISTSAPIWWRTSMVTEQSIWGYKTPDNETAIGAVQDGRIYAKAARDQTAGIAATLAGIVKSESAIQATLAAITAGGSSVDTAALAAQIKAVGDKESADMAALLAANASLTSLVASLTAKLAAAAKAEATALTAS